VLFRSSLPFSVRRKAKNEFGFRPKNTMTVVYFAGLVAAALCLTVVIVGGLMLFLVLRRARLAAEATLDLTLKATRRRIYFRNLDIGAPRRSPIRTILRARNNKAFLNAFEVSVAMYDSILEARFEEIYLAIIDYMYRCYDAATPRRPSQHVERRPPHDPDGGVRPQR
jgi:hypothetical protein